MGFDLRACRRNPRFHLRRPLRCPILAFGAATAAAAAIGHTAQTAVWSHRCSAGIPSPSIPQISLLPNRLGVGQRGPVGQKGRKKKRKETARLSLCMPWKTELLPTRRAEICLPGFARPFSAPTRRTGADGGTVNVMRLTCRSTRGYHEMRWLQLIQTISSTATC